MSAAAALAAQDATHVDVLIVGAGISGIGSAYHLQDQCPDKSYAILENEGHLWWHLGHPQVSRRAL